MPRRRVKPPAGRDTRPVRPEDLFPNGPGCTWQRKERGDARLSVVTGGHPECQLTGSLDQAL